MTGPEHYREAEAWACKAAHAGARETRENAGSCAAIAQVHAQLATAAALALGTAFAAGILPPGTVRERADVIVPEPCGAGIEISVPGGGDLSHLKSQLSRTAGS